jgi:3',5'-cyclic AMP phosphodiesterase CpdA
MLKFHLKYLILFLLFVGCTTQKEKDEYSNFDPTVYPDRIMLTIPGDPATSRAVSWRTVYEDTVSIGEIALMDAAPTLEENKVTVTGTFSPWEKGSQAAMGHKVIFENLKPDTKYAYRVGDYENWSEWFQFKTSSDKAEPFSFLYLGDVQNDIKSYGSRILRQSYTHFPNADFMLFTGDLVKESNEEYWREFFYAGGWIFGMMPSVSTPGNHEYDERVIQSRTFSKHWNQIFTMPPNGPSEKFSNRLYYIDYQGVRFISVDSPAYGENSEDDEMILGWLDKTLANNPNRWAVVFTHYPVYYCCQGRDKKQYQDVSKIIFEKYGVDIVLQGHDHTYCRGQNLPNAGVNSKNHPMYIVSVAGEKMYGLTTTFWADRVASNTQLYQNITFSGDTLSYKSFIVAGELYDEFMLIKDKNGINRFIESDEVRGIDQRIEIPEGEEEEYTDEEMKIYQQKFQNK